MLRFGLAAYGRATPSASRQLPREGAGYYETHVVGKSPRPMEASLRCASRIWPRGMRNVGKCCRWKGNSLSLSGVCGDRGQLPREGASYHKIHVVGESCSAENFLSPRAVPATQQKAPSRPRLRRRRAGSRRRRETGGVARGRSDWPRCATFAVRPYGRLPATGKIPATPKATPSALAVSATTAGSTRPTRPPRGSRVLKDSCSR